MMVLVVLLTMIMRCDVTGEMGVRWYRDDGCIDSNDRWYCG